MFDNKQRHNMGYTHAQESLCIQNLDKNGVKLTVATKGGVAADHLLMHLRHA
jgi:hypothetical protein